MALGKGSERKKERNKRIKCVKAHRVLLLLTYGPLQTGALNQLCDYEIEVLKSEISYIHT